MSDEKKPGAAAPEEAAPRFEDGGPVMPKVTFTTFILSLASSALVQLGEVPDPVSGKLEEPNLPIAKHTIDVLTMLRAKTQCSLTDEEAQMMDGLLYELRMKYVLKSE